MSYCERTALKQRGFTLVEFAIVLVIVGIVIGAILAGSSLREEAALRSIIGTLQNYRTAIEAFTTKYNALPGDMNFARTLWSTSGNGNGDGIVQSTETVVGEGIEHLRVWDHLGRSGILDRTFNYTGAITPSTSVPDLKGGILTLTGTTSFYGRTGNQLTLGSLALQGFLNAKEAHAIDSKLDDGEADKGALYTVHGTTPVVGRCVTGAYNVATTSSYILTDTSKNCRIVWWMDRSD